MTRLRIANALRSLGRWPGLGLSASALVLLTVAVVLSADPSAPSSPTPGDEAEAQPASTSTDDPAVESEWETFAVDVTDLQQAQMALHMQPGVALAEDVRPLEVMEGAVEVAGAPGGLG